MRSITAHNSRRGAAICGTWVHTRRQAYGWGSMTIGAVLTYLIFFPGLMSTDSYFQLQQARTGHFNDWWPPIMAWLWSLIEHFIPGPQGFFIVIILLYWGGFGLICTHCSQGTRKRFLAAVILPYLPFLINFAGTVGKDQLVFGCFLTSLGLILLQPKGRAFKIATGSTIVLLLLVGLLARYNSVLAAIPLVVLWIWPSPTTARPLTSLGLRLAACGAVILLLWLGSSNAFNRYVVQPERTGFQNPLFAWELVGLSHLTHENLVPGSWSMAETREIIGRCYDPSSSNSVVFDECRFIADELHRSGEWKSGLLAAFMRASIVHPVLYLKTRLLYLHTLIWPNQIFVYRGGPLSTPTQNNEVFKLMSYAFTWMQTAPVVHFIFTLLFWMVVSLMVAALSLLFWVRGRAEFYKPFLIALSAVLYILPLAVIGIAGDFRYGYWSIAATCISVLMWPRNARSMARQEEPGKADLVV